MSRAGAAAGERSAIDKSCAGRRCHPPSPPSRCPGRSRPSWGITSSVEVSGGVTAVAPATSVTLRLRGGHPDGGRLRPALQLLPPHTALLVAADSEVSTAVDEVLQLLPLKLFSRLSGWCSEHCRGRGPAGRPPAGGVDVVRRLMYRRGPGPAIGLSWQSIVPPAVRSCFGSGFGWPDVQARKV